ncbi:MAG: bifunctional hydroxymethylpyrimidine kinase/phosphomethylpyrimidine kinase [Rhodospirillales bacterium]|nr:bifunctional hydroxymethylpyrimidine kinase/phosphomethylpyrimidine kinase [Rhodospirillales bacterium]
MTNGAPAQRSGRRFGRLLVVAGSDSGGGAGLQADLKTATSMGVYAMSAVTAVTAQDTHRVHQTLHVPPDLVALQMRTALEDIGADAIKTGMLCTKATIEALLETVAGCAAGIPLIVDPVLTATSGETLLEPDAEAVLRERLVRQAYLVTPNAPEAARLTGCPVSNQDEMLAAGRHMLAMGARAVLITEAEVQEFAADRLDTPHTHGTGCTLASAIAAGIADGRTLIDATSAGHAYVQRALRTAPGLGGGRGPLNHLA